MVAGITFLPAEFGIQREQVCNKATAKQAE
jgi:hypothetical protein